MQTRLLLGGLVVAGWSAWLCAQTPEGPPRVEDLIEKLGSSSFAEREKAQKALKTLDITSLAALKKASDSADLEVKRRLEEVIRRLEEKKLNDEVLAPKKVRLNVKNVTVNEAVNELAKLSGYPLQLQGDLALAKEKKISIDTGEVTFWEALDLLCDKGGLVDVTNQQQAAATNPRPPINKGIIRVRPPIQAVPLPAPIQPLPPVQQLPGAPKLQLLPRQPAPGVFPLPEGPKAPNELAVPEVVRPVENESFEGENGAQQNDAPKPEAPKPEPAKPVQVQAQPVQAQPVQAQPVQAQVQVQVQGQPAQAQPVQVQVQQIQIGGIGGIIGPNVGGLPNAPKNITLKVDEKAKPAPTSYHGATRLRILAADNKNNADKNYTLTLDVSPEPRLQSFRIDGNPSIEKAIDENGQSLTVAMDAEKNDPNAQLNPFNGNIMIGGPIGFAMPGTGRQVALRLVKGDKASKSLKELKGSITAEVEIPNEKLMEIPDILKADGQKIKTTSGTVHVRSVKKQDNGDYVVHLVRDGQNANNPFGGGIAIGGGGRIVIRGGGGMIINGRNIGPAPDKDAPKLIDTKGNAFQVAGFDKALIIENNNANEEMTITYRPNPGQQEPSNLVQYGSRAVKVSIPFAFRDVPLP